MTKRLLVALLLLCPVTAWAQPTLVGSNGTSCTAGATSCQASAGIAVNAGDLLVGMLAVRGASTLLSVTAGDATNGASAWTCPAGTNIYGGGDETQAAACYYLSSGAATIQPTVNVSGGTTNSLYWAFYVWRDGTWSLDQLNENDYASGGPYSHGSITTTGSSGVIHTSSMTNAAGTETVASGFTQGPNLTLREVWQYRTTTGAVTTDGAYTSDTSHDGVGVIISFSSASGGAGCTGGVMLMGAGKCE